MLKISRIFTYLWCFLAIGLGSGGVSQVVAGTMDAAGLVKPAAETIIDLVPDQLNLSGHVATNANSQGQCTASWLADMPLGSIILGVNPISCDPANWGGGSAVAQVYLPDVYSPTVYVLEISWPDVGGKGLHSPLQNQVATIMFDGNPLFSKRTGHFGPFGDYYAAQHGPIVTTLVVNQSLTHTLELRVLAQTAWDISQIELRALPFPTAIRGIGYSPYRDCQYPGSPLPVPDMDDLWEDLFRLSHTTTAIRTYSATGVNGQVPALAQTLGLPVYAGAWLDNLPQDEAEIQALIDLAQTNLLAGVIVGNEYYLRHRSDQDLAYLQQRMLSVKNSIPTGVPVTTAEIDNLMFAWDGDALTIQSAYRPILDLSDIIMVHIYPFWNGMPIDGAAEFTVERYEAIQQLLDRQYPGQNKRVIIGETGWPSRGSSNGSALPSMVNQERFLREFISLAETAGVDYLYFDAIDELWKIEEPGHVGQNWGYSYTDRAAKHGFYGLLIPANLLPPLVPQPSAPFHVYLPYSGAVAKPTFPVYSEWPEGPGRFIPSGWMGDLDRINLFACDRTGPHNGEMAMRQSFSRGGPQGWGGVYWQYPENNWGDLPGGIDLSGATQVTFWARSDTPEARVKFIIGGIGYATDHLGRAICTQPLAPYPDSACPKIEQGETLTTHWRKYTIDFQNYPRDLSRVIGGFGWVSDQTITFYLDDIYYEFDH